MRLFSQAPEWAWRFRLLQAEILTLRGQNESVPSLLTSDLPPSLANGELNIRKHIVLAVANARLGHFDLADSDLREADRLCAASTCPVSGELERAHGVVEMERDNLNDAEIFFRKSLQIARDQHDDFLDATDLLNLGTVAMRQEHYDESIDWATAADKTFTALDAPLTEEKIQGNLGYAYYKMGDYEKALTYYQDAVRRAQTLQAVSDETLWETRIGDVFADLNQPSEAEDSYRKALALIEQTKYKKQIIDITNSLAFLSVQTGKLDIAEHYCEQARSLAAADGDRLDYLYPLLAKGEIAARRTDSMTAEKIFREVAEDKDSETSLRWESNHELAKLFESERRFSDAERQYRNGLRIFESARSSVQQEESRLPFLANANDLYGDYIDFLVEQGRIAEALQVADYGRARTLTEGVERTRKASSLAYDEVNPQNLARNAKATILFYELRPKHSLLWAIGPNHTELIHLPPAPEIDTAVQAYRKTLLGPRDALETAIAQGTALFDMLIRPAMSSLPSSGRVVIVPDGSLNNLNFETLLVAEPRPHYWIEDVTILNASSLRLLGAPRRGSTAATPNILLIGNAVASDPAYGELPNASIEMEDIEKRFDPTHRRSYAHAEATALAYLDNHPENFSYIHFVAHGIASRLSPLESAVILSAVPGQTNSFKLYARDIIKVPLHADLVTISSCNASGVRAYTGEGLVGLSWAFLRAGAHNVIGALWDVNDASTPQLMNELYGELIKGKDPADALRAAKLSLLHSDSVYRKPFYWAPFELYLGS